MTQIYKKIAELHYLREYLRIANVDVADDDIDEGERPDFRLHVGHATIGVEVTDYHVSGSRREVEEHWGKLRQWPMHLLDYPQYRYADLHFKELQLPPRRLIGAFVSEIIALTSGAVKTRERIELDPARHPVSAAYLRHVDLEPSKLRRQSWGWNHDIAWIGVGEEELIAILEQKLHSAVAPASSHWLMITEGPGLSRVMAFMDHEWLEPFTRLTKALNDGPFDRLVLLQSPVIEWRRGEGWSTVGTAGS